MEEEEVELFDGEDGTYPDVCEMMSLASQGLTEEFDDWERAE